MNEQLAHKARGGTPIPPETTGGNPRRLVKHKSFITLTHSRGRASATGAAGILRRRGAADLERWSSKGGGLRGELGGLLLIVEGLRYLPAQRPQPFLPLGSQRLGHLRRRRNKQQG